MLIIFAHSVIVGNLRSVEGKRRDTIVQPFITCRCIVEYSGRYKKINEVNCTVQQRPITRVWELNNSNLNRCEESLL